MNPTMTYSVTSKPHRSLSNFCSSSEGEHEVSDFNVGQHRRSHPDDGSCCAIEPTPIGPVECLNIVAEVTPQQNSWYECHRQMLLTVLQPLSREKTLDCSPFSGIHHKETRMNMPPESTDMEAMQDKIPSCDSFRLNASMARQKMSMSTYRDQQPAQCDVPREARRSEATHQDKLPLHASFTARCSPISRKQKSAQCDVPTEARRSEATRQDKRPPGDSFTSPSLPMSNYREQQSSQWDTRYAELCEYRDKYGDTLVPYNWNENHSLAQWVKRQRYQQRRSNLTGRRQALLSKLGFVWDTHRAAWEEKVSELKRFKLKHGHCNVPCNHEDSGLAIWVKSQRRQYKLNTAGEKTTLTPERRDRLDRMGFVWNPPRGTGRRRSSLLPGVSQAS